MRIDVLTIFPEYFSALDVSLLGKARAADLLDLRIRNLRDYATDRHRSVDDTPYGGGPGMVMTPGPWGDALDALLADTPPDGSRPRLVVPTPGGRRLTQSVAQELAGEPWLAFACGRYEGIDRRVIEDAAQRMPVEELSIGDYVVNGGEVAVLVIVEAVARLLPGVLGNAESLVEESHADGLLEYPVYTKPATWRGRAVPEVLLSGHHGEIRRWRRTAALRHTAQLRPDLLAALEPARLDAEELAVLAAAGWTVQAGRLVRGFPAVAD